MSDPSKRESWLTKPPNQGEARFSMSSFASQGSYNPSEVGEAVPVPMLEQRGDRGEVRQMYVVNRDIDSADDEEESLFSQSQAPLGRLDTIKRRSQTEIVPEMTVQTELKETIPPRLRRRPMSEIYPRGHAAADFTKTHHHRVSLNISDDLDKLMARAKDLKRTDASLDDEHASSSPGKSISSVSSPVPGTYSSGSAPQISPDSNTGNPSSGTPSGFSRARGKVVSMNFSTDSFDTAEEHNTAESSEFESQLRFVLPKRPNEDNMRKARQASANHAQHTNAINESGAVSPGKPVRPRPELNNSADSLVAGYNESSLTLELKGPQFTPPDAPFSPEGIGRIDSTSSRYLSSDNGSEKNKYSSGLYSKASFEESHVNVRPMPEELTSDASSAQKEENHSTKLDDKHIREPVHNFSIPFESSQLAEGSDESVCADFGRNSLTVTQNPEDPGKLHEDKASKLDEGEARKLEQEDMTGKFEENDMDGNLVEDDVAAKFEEEDVAGKFEEEDVAGKLREDYVAGKFEDDVAGKLEEDGMANKLEEKEFKKVSPSRPASEIFGRQSKKQASEEGKVSEQVQNDEDFYDIEEPVLVSKAVRSKSVKASTCKSAKRKSKHIKTRDTSAGRLKPFSYNTLVHLLESMNGSVIGEEFELLNLPIREKQLIEKIVDLLSRLTLDMVIDENRYEVGIDRLERAHRVLEGFL